MGDFLKKAYDDAEQYQEPATTSFHIWPIVVGTIVGNILGMITYYQIIQPILF